MQKKRPLHTLQNRAQVHDSLRLPYERDLTIEPNGNDVLRDDPLCKNCAKRWVSERIPWLLPTAGRYNRARGFQPGGMYKCILCYIYIFMLYYVTVYIIIYIFLQGLSFKSSRPCA